MIIYKIDKNKISTAVTFLFHISSFNDEFFCAQSPNIQTLVPQLPLSPPC